MCPDYEQITVSTITLTKRRKSFSAIKTAVKTERGSRGVYVFPLQADDVPFSPNEIADFKYPMKWQMT